MWGLVVNEAMFFNCMPVVSAMVGCAPDLVDGIGEIHAVGDVKHLSLCIENVLKDMNERKKKIPDRIAEYSLKNAVDGIIAGTIQAFEEHRGRD